MKMKKWKETKNMAESKIKKKKKHIIQLTQKLKTTPTMINHSFFLSSLQDVNRKRHRNAIMSLIIKKCYMYITLFEFFVVYCRASTRRWDELDGSTTRIISARLCAVVVYAQSPPKNGYACGNVPNTLKQLESNVQMRQRFYWGIQ